MSIPRSTAVTTSTASDPAGARPAKRGTPEQHAARAALDPRRAQGWLDEWERWRGAPDAEPNGHLIRSLVVFLTGAECPFSCVFCDLWQHTLVGPTPAGALVTQIEGALEAAQQSRPDAQWHTVKLYNASNWFDERAVPQCDDARLIELSGRFERVVVECHPRLVPSARTESWARRLAADGSQLEVALGLETTDEEAFRWLRKGCSLEAFERAAGWLHDRGATTRAFLLVDLPPLRQRRFDRQVAAVVDSVRTAADWGVDSVALIPLREPTSAAPAMAPVDRLRLLEECFHASREAVDPVSGGPCLVRVDAWDLDRLRDGGCACVGRRLEALDRISRKGTLGACNRCEQCGSTWANGETSE